jgi:hypothetical protein
LSAQGGDFAQHAQTIVQEANFASLLMIPAHRYLTQAQTGVLRQIKQLDIKGESVEMCTR